jgi:hypothetical protein
VLGDQSVFFVLAVAPFLPVYYEKSWHKASFFLGFPADLETVGKGHVALIVILAHVAQQATTLTN